MAQNDPFQNQRFTSVRDDIDSLTRQLHKFQQCSIPDGTLKLIAEFREWARLMDTRPTFTEIRREIAPVYIELAKATYAALGLEYEIPKGFLETPTEEHGDYPSASYHVGATDAFTPSS